MPTADPWESHIRPKLREKIHQKSLLQLNGVVEQVINSYRNDGMTEITAFLKCALDSYEAYKNGLGSTDNESLYVFFEIAARIISVVIPSLKGFKEFVDHRSGGKKSIYDQLTDLIYHDKSIVNVKAALSRPKDDALLNRLEKLKKPLTSQDKPSQQQAPQQEEPPEDFWIGMAAKKTISVTELFPLIRKYPNRLLLIDARSRKEYETTRIACDNVIYIEPVSLRQNYTVRDIETSALSTNPSTHVELFAKRSSFALTVVYGEPETAKRILSILKSKCVLLDGTEDEWLKLFGKPLLLRRSSSSSSSSLPSSSSSVDSAFPRNFQYSTSSRNSPSVEGLQNGTEEFALRHFSKDASTTQDGYKDASVEKLQIFRTRNGFTPTPSPETLSRLVKAPTLNNLNIVTGLSNLGNTCYMNCVLQCLAGTKQLTPLFIDTSYAKFVNLASRLGSKGVLVKAFHELIKELYRNSNPDGGSVKYIVPARFKKIMGSLNSNFKTFDQQDCSEFLNFLLDGLHEDLNQCGNHPPLPDLNEQEEEAREKLPIRIASTIEWEKYLKTNFSIIVDQFQGQYLSRLECLKCNKTSTTYNSFSTLSLPIPSRSRVTLSQCFDEFCAPEILDGEDRWFCPRCKAHEKSSKTLRISRLPQVLIIHLKRFQLGSHITKLNTFVEYPHEVNLDKYWPRVQSREEMEKLVKLPMRNQMTPFNYKLFGVVDHFGNLTTGHYTSYIYKGEKSKWCYFDDTKIYRNVDIKRVVNGDAYVLFYSRV